MLRHRERAGSDVPVHTLTRVQPPGFVEVVASTPVATSYPPASVKTERFGATGG
jgi:hypothetical protein